jgi:hypothetical protein
VRAKTSGIGLTETLSIALGQHRGRSASTPAVPAATAYPGLSVADHCNDPVPTGQKASPAVESRGYREPTHTCPSRQATSSEPDSSVRNNVAPADSNDVMLCSLG